MTKLRIVRPTDHMAEIIRFYRDGLGLEILDSFEDRDGLDAVFLGKPGTFYHLAFTHYRGHPAGRAPTQDNLLVFYLPEEEAWQQAVERMHAHGYEPVKSYNPYWDVRGETFEDPDGFRVVLQNASWDV
jgi:catechol 2,3-dioxygenase-like lactoylglutathione lyase family enzyme